MAHSGSVGETAVTSKAVGKSCRWLLRFADATIIHQNDPLIDTGLLVPGGLEPLEEKIECVDDELSLLFD